jgi:hypothetical protein
MAKAQSKSGESVQGYFRKIFDENPKLLRKRSNDELFQRWLKDHPGTSDVPTKVKQGLANLKSVLRNRRKTRKKIRAEGPVEKPSAKIPAASLIRLESLVDEALVYARHLDREGLDDIIRNLHTARNTVIKRMA